MIKGDAHNRYHDAFLAGLKGGFVDMSFKTVRLPTCLYCGFLNLTYSAHQLADDARYKHMRVLHRISTRNWQRLGSVLRVDICEAPQHGWINKENCGLPNSSDCRRRLGTYNSSTETSGQFVVGRAPGEDSPCSSTYRCPPQIISPNAWGTGKARDRRLWRIGDDRKRFEEVPCRYQPFGS